MKNNPECLGGQMPAGRRFFRNLRPAGARRVRCRRAGHYCYNNSTSIVNNRPVGERMTIMLMLLLLLMMMMTMMMTIMMTMTMTMTTMTVTTMMMMMTTTTRR